MAWDPNSRTLVAVSVTVADPLSNHAFTFHDNYSWCHNQSQHHVWSTALTASNTVFLWIGVDTQAPPRSHGIFCSTFIVFRVSLRFLCARVCVGIHFRYCVCVLSFPCRLHNTRMHICICACTCVRACWCRSQSCGHCQGYHRHRYTTATFPLAHFLASSLAQEEGALNSSHGLFGLPLHNKHCTRTPHVYTLTHILKFPDHKCTLTCARSNINTHIKPHTHTPHTYTYTL